MQFASKISWMIHILIFQIIWNLVEMCVQLFIALSAQLVMIWLSTYLQMGFLVLVLKWFPLLIQKNSMMHGFHKRFPLLPLSAYHAGLNSKSRSSVLDDWISSRTQVVVATVAFGYVLSFFHLFSSLLNSCVCVYLVFLSKWFAIYLLYISWLIFTEKSNSPQHDSR